MMTTYKGRLRAAAAALSLLAATDFDREDAIASEAYYRLADPHVAAIVATPARDLEEIRIKAETVAWCCASRRDFGLDGPAMSERVITSLLRDILELDS